MSVLIRPYETDDAPGLFEAVRESIDEVGTWLEWCHPGYSIEESREWIAHCIACRAAGVEYNFAILDRAGRFLGGVGLNRLEPQHRTANLGYWVRSSAAGSGVATAASRQLVEFAFRETNLNRLQILAAVENRPSQRVAEKLGAVRECVVRGRLFAHGSEHDAAQYAILRRDVRAEAPDAE